MGGMNFDGATVDFLHFDHDAQIGARLTLPDGRRFVARVALADYETEEQAAAALVAKLGRQARA